MSTFVVPLDIKREASFTTLNVMMDGMNSPLRSPAVWEKLEILRQQRTLQGKTINRTLVGAKCPNQPLHDVCTELVETREVVSLTCPLKINIDVSQPKLLIHDYIPLYKLADATVPYVQGLKKTRLEMIKDKRVRIVAPNDGRRI